MHCSRSSASRNFTSRTTSTTTMRSLCRWVSVSRASAETSAGTRSSAPNSVRFRGATVPTCQPGSPLTGRTRPLARIQLIRYPIVYPFIHYLLWSVFAYEITYNYYIFDIFLYIISLWHVHLFYYIIVGCSIINTL